MNISNAVHLTWCVCVCVCVCVLCVIAFPLLFSPSITSFVFILFDIFVGLVVWPPSLPPKCTSSSPKLSLKSSAAALASLRLVRGVFLTGEFAAEAVGVARQDTTHTKRESARARERKNERERARERDRERARGSKKKRGGEREKERSTREKKWQYFSTSRSREYRKC